MKGKVLIGLAAIFFLSAAFTLQQPKPWPVPDNAAKVKNPVKPGGESNSAGKALWQEHCSPCHGKAGAGDGNKAAQLKTTLTDFSKPDYQSQSDGTLFYKISEGRDEMPTYKKKIPDPDDIWNLVNYTRTFKK
jgi:mono/diheme cytochrome c family protein